MDDSHKIQSSENRQNDEADTDSECREVYGGSGSTGQDIRDIVSSAYSEAIEDRATTPGALGVDITDMMLRNNYDRDAMDSETSAAADESFGCGNPVKEALLKEGERVLDLGCGAGLDLILTSKGVGPSGHVYGLDMTPKMLDRARKNLKRLGIKNVTLLKGFIEDLPLHDESAEVLISNCVINLSPDKERVFSEAFRILTPGGRFCVSDVVLLRPVPEKLKSSPAAWSG